MPKTNSYNPYNRITRNNSKNISEKTQILTKDGLRSIGANGFIRKKSNLGSGAMEMNLIEDLVTGSQKTSNKKDDSEKFEGHRNESSTSHSKVIQSGLGKEDQESLARSIEGFVGAKNGDVRTGFDEIRSGRKQDSEMMVNGCAENTGGRDGEIVMVDKMDGGLRDRSGMDSIQSKPLFIDKMRQGDVYKTQLNFQSGFNVQKTEQGSNGFRWSEVVKPKSTNLRMKFDYSYPCD